MRGAAAAVPLLLGDDDGSPARSLVVKTAGVAGNARVGNRVWVHGSGVQDAIDRGDFEAPLPASSPIRRTANTVYWVGNRGFTNRERAEIVSRSTGQPITEKPVGSQ